MNKRLFYVLQHRDSGAFTVHAGSEPEPSWETWSVIVAGLLTRSEAESALRNLSPTLIPEPA